MLNPAEAQPKMGPVRAPCNDRDPPKPTSPSGGALAAEKPEKGYTA
jgi:hypothetical protein